MLPSFDMQTGWDDFVENLSDNLPIAADITVTVGSGGDYPTINAALEALSRKYPLYKKEGHTVEISLLSGFIMQEQVLLRGVDLSYITISSVSAEVVIDREYLTENFRASAFPAFAGDNSSKLPIINTLFNMNTTGDAAGRDAFGLWDASTLVIKGNKGIKNAGGNGVYLSHASLLNADRAIIIDSGNHNIFAAEGATANADKCQLKGAGASALRANRNARIFAGAEDGSALQKDTTDCGDIAIHALNNSIIEAAGRDVSGCVGAAATAISGSIINFEGGKCDGGPQDGVVAARGSIVNADGVELNDIARYAIYALRASRINAQGAAVTNTGNQDMYARGASSINAVGGSYDKGAAALEGGIVSIHGATLGASFATTITINTLAHQGIIFGTV